jgi:hypothetical protein
MLVYFDHGMYLRNYMFCSLRLLRYFVYMHVEFLDCVRRSVYFLNICYIRMFYRFNRNMALQKRANHV